MLMVGSQAALGSDNDDDVDTECDSYLLLPPFHSAPVPPRSIRSHGRGKGRRHDGIELMLFTEVGRVDRMPS
jgi:hypothetical protein